MVLAKNMKINYHFRKPSPHFHSIEEQFFAVEKALPKEAKYKNIFAPYHSKGLFRRLGIALYAAFHQGEVNHITGDIHFAALFLKKRKTILTIHDIGSVLKGGGIKRKVLRFFWFSMPFARVRYVTVISEFTKREIMQQFTLSPDKIKVIPDAVSSDFAYSPKAFNSKKPRILNIGTKQNKNLERLIPALEGIACRLVIIGRLSEAQSRLLAKHHIDFENYFNLPFSEIVAHYHQCDLLSFVSLYEGFGVPVLEAQAMGRPVITSNCSPMTEVAGTGALFVNPEDTNAIRNGILQIIEDSGLREGLIAAGLENAKQYRPEAIAKKYYDLYRELLAKN